VQRLLYRFGARVSEAMALRRKDIVWQGDRLIMLLRPNDYREIKTDAGIRQVPLIGPLSTTERRIVDGWIGHIDEMASCDRMAALFGDRDRPRTLMGNSLAAPVLRVATRRFAYCGSAERWCSNNRCFVLLVRALMTTEEVSVDLVLHRPASVLPKRWTEVLMDLCCRRLVPDLKSFSIGTEQGHLSIGVDDHAPGGALSLNLNAVAAIYVELARTHQPTSAPKPRGVVGLPNPGYRGRDVIWPDRSHAARGL